MTTANKPKDSAYFDFLSIGLIKRMLKSRLFQTTIILPSLFVFMVLIWAGFVGTPVGGQNATIMMVWVFWFGLLAILLIPFGGRLWCMLCPLPSAGEWISRGTVIGLTKKGHNRGIKWPLRLDNIWIQNIGFMVVASLGTLSGSFQPDQFVFIVHSHQPRKWLIVNGKISMVNFLFRG